MLTAAIIALALAADPPPKKDALKDAVKDAVAAPAEKKNGLDLSKMPFTPDSIKQVVASYQPQIQGCYEEHLAAKDKAVEGTLKTSFVITGDGYVKAARVNKKTSSLKDARLHDCVVAVLSAMEFPKPPDGKEQPIDFPFNLKAQH
jgi:hypothetical protein